MSQSIPQRLAKYKILDVLGQGGFSTVYKAEDTTLGRIVALKVLDPLLLRDPTFIERFRLEARAVANLYHPHIVALHEMGESEGTFYLAMQYVDGPPLNKQLTGEPLPLAETAAIVSDIASALDYAHEQGLVHRDVKPSNILLDRKGRAYLSDFGIVKALEATRVMTSRGAIVGTPEYMSPEQAQSLDLDGRADVYSLGVVAYQMCTGQVPFTGSTPTSVHYKHVHEPPPPPSSLHPQAGGPVEAVLLRALAKQPDDRYAAAGDFAQALAEAVTEIESGWLQEQVAEAGAWIEGGRYRQAIERLAPLAQAHPDDEEIADLLARARERARLAELYDETQRLWTEAEAKAAEIAAADPDYDDPQGVLARLREPEPVPRPKAAPVEPTQPPPAEAKEAEEWPGWISKAALVAVIVGSVAVVILHLPTVWWSGYLAVCSLLVLSAILASWQRFPLPTRRGLAIFALILALYTTAWSLYTPDPNYYWWIQAALSLLQLGALLGTAAMVWILITEKRNALARGLVALGVLAVSLSYLVPWLHLRYKYSADQEWSDLTHRGVDVVFQSHYPFWVGSAIVLLPALSLFSVVLLSLAHDNPDPSKRQKQLFASVLLAGLAIPGMIAINFIKFTLQSPPLAPFFGFTGGTQLMLLGLVLIFISVLIQTIPLLRASRK